MDLATLRAFLSVVRQQSFTMAASELGLTQPGVTRQVQRVEREVGAQLLERRRGRLTLTAAGERFFAYAEDAVTRHQRMRADLQELIAHPQGTLRIAASTVPGEFVVPSLLAEFGRRYPGVEPQVFITDSAVVAEELREHRWDVGFTGGRAGGRGLRYEPVYDDEIVLVVPSGHRLSARGEVALSDLGGEAFIEREAGSGTLQTVHAALTAQGLALPAHSVAMVLGTTDAVIAAVERGYGIGWASTAALEHRGPGRVVAVRVRGLRLRRPLYMVTREQGVLPPPAEAFVRAVRERLGQIGEASAAGGRARRARMPHTASRAAGAGRSSQGTP